jgi:hypothetical protein
VTPRGVTGHFLICVFHTNAWHEPTPLFSTAPLPLSSGTARLPDWTPDCQIGHLPHRVTVISGSTGNSRHLRKIQINVAPTLHVPAQLSQSERQNLPRPSRALPALLAPPPSLPRPLAPAPAPNVPDCPIGRCVNSLRLVGPRNGRNSHKKELTQAAKACVRTFTAAAFCHACMRITPASVERLCYCSTSSWRVSYVKEVTQSPFSSCVSVANPVMM